MKKLFIFAVAMAASLSAAAFDYNTITFEMAGGEKHVVGVENLDITFEPNALVATHAEGTLRLDLSQLRKFYFTGAAVGINAIGIESSKPVDVYSVSGVYMGRYASATEVETALPTGVYVIRSEDETVKTFVR